MINNFLSVKINKLKIFRQQIMSNLSLKIADQWDNLKK